MRDQPCASDTYRRRSLDPWFDDCGAVIRRTRELERVVSHAAPRDVAVVTDAAWLAQRRTSSS